MKNKRRELTKTASKNAAHAIAADPLESPEARTRRARHLHSKAITSHVYANQTLAIAKHDDIQSTAVEHVAEMLRRLNCHDPLEEMLAAQALWTHARIGRLSMLAQQQEQVNTIKVVNDACDRASNTYRRLMLTLVEYRRPPRTDSFVAIKQANVAQQQVVQNVENQKSKPIMGANEKGSEAIVPTLPAHPGGIGSAPTIDRTHETVEANHRPLHTAG